MRYVLDFDPLPFVRARGLHLDAARGSFLASRRSRALLAKMIALPGELTRLGESLLRNDKELPSGLEPRIPTSLDNMKASNPFLQLLASTPLARA